MLPDDQVHPDTHALTMVNNVIAAPPSPRNFVIADRLTFGLSRLSSCHCKWSRGCFPRVLAPACP